MDYSVASQAAKRFEQKSKDNHEIEEIKKRMMAVLREDLINKIGTDTHFLSISSCHGDSSCDNKI